MMPSGEPRPATRRSRREQEAALSSSTVLPIVPGGSADPEAENTGGTMLVWRCHHSPVTDKADI
jgi:hypothetical protein